MNQHLTRITMLALALAFILLAQPVDRGTRWHPVPRAEAQARPNIIVIVPTQNSI